MKWIVDPVDLGRELRQRVQLRLRLAPVVVGRPIARERLQRLQLYALRPVLDKLLARPTCRCDPAAELDELLFRNLDVERPDLGGGLDRGHVDLRSGHRIYDLGNRDRRVRKNAATIQHRPSQMRQASVKTLHQFETAERRRSRTYRAVGCTTAPVLKTSWATGPMPLRNEPSAARGAPIRRRRRASPAGRPTAPEPCEPGDARTAPGTLELSGRSQGGGTRGNQGFTRASAPVLKTSWATGPMPLRNEPSAGFSVVCSRRSAAGAGLRPAGGSLRPKPSKHKDRLRVRCLHRRGHLHAPLPGVLRRLTVDAGVPADRRDADPRARASDDPQRRAAEARYLPARRRPGSRSSTTRRAGCACSCAA